MQYKILVVDDETANLRLIERLFRGTYDVMTASSGFEAKELLSVHDFSLIICDQRMPGMTGIEFLKIAAEMRPQTVRIMLTGYSDAETLVEAINSGSVYKYVTKPWVNEELLQTAKRALQHYESLRAQRHLQIQHERLQARVGDLRDLILTLAGEILDSETPLAAGLAHRRRERAIKIARGFGLSFSEVESLGSAAFLYDFATSFNSPTSTGHRVQLEHVLDAIYSAPEFQEALSILNYSNERYDGTGGPNGFAGDEIPLAARIVAVANEAVNVSAISKNLDSFVSDEELSAVLQQLAGTKLDPQIVDTISGHTMVRLPADSAGTSMYVR